MDGDAMIIAKSKVYGRKGRGRRVPVVVQVGAPKRDPLGSMSCKVHLRGIRPPRVIHGEDALQALALAFTFLRMTVLELYADGWLFYFGARDREPFDLRAVWFPSWGESELQKPKKRRGASRKPPHVIAPLR